MIIASKNGSMVWYAQILSQRYKVKSNRVRHVYAAHFKN